MSHFIIVDIAGIDGIRAIALRDLPSDRSLQMWLASFSLYFVGLPPGMPIVYRNLRAVSTTVPRTYFSSCLSILSFGNPRRLRYFRIAVRITGEISTFVPVVCPSSMAISSSPAT